MTKEKIAGTTKDVVIPGVVALAIVGLAVKAIGLIPASAGANPLENRITAVEARQIAFEQIAREDRNQIMSTIMEIKVAVARIESKVEKRD